MKPRPHHEGVTIPAPKPGPNVRPHIVHNAMWLAYVFDGLSASDTADQLNRELRVKETRGSVLGYASRQGWQKSQINSVPCPATAPTAQVERIVTLAKAPMRQEPILPPPPRRREGPIAYVAPPPPPKREVVVDLGDYLAAPAAPTAYGPAVLMELHPSQCKFPIARVMHLGLMEHQFCGKRRVEGEPYCGAHCKRAYTAGTSKPKAR